MNGKNLIITALIGTIILASLLSIIDNQPAEAAHQENAISCINPTTTEEQTACREMESQILAATVRIEMHTWATFGGGYTKDITTESYATILAGKYLLTHNHFRYSLTDQVKAYGETKGYTGISIRSTNGELLLENAPLTAYSIVHEDPETLILAFLDENGRGLFERAGFPSAQFSDWNDIDWRTGMELAQVDWDGESAHIDWTIIESLNLTDQAPQIQINNFPKKGCSGGGVYLNGIHIGNNWAKNIEKDPETDEITRRYSIIALNSQAVSELE